MIDVLKNEQYLSRDDIEDLLLKKEKFCVWKLVAQHKGLKKTHDRNRGKRIHLDMQISKYLNVYIDTNGSYQFAKKLFEWVRPFCDIGA